MAQELSFNYSLSVQNPSATGTLATGQQPFKDSVSNQLQLTQNGVGENAGVLSVTTVANGLVVPVGSVSTLGVLWVRNLDTTNYLQLGVRSAGTFLPFARVKPGEDWIVRLDPSITLYALANTATVLMEFKLLQD